MSKKKIQAVSAHPAVSSKAHFNILFFFFLVMVLYGDDLAKMCFVRFASVAVVRLDFFFFSLWGE